MPSAGATILVVDDQPANLNLLAGLLKEQGFNVRLAPSGELALLAAQHAPPDLFLLDILMPGMNGYDVCEQLKKDTKLASVPVIFLSALNETVDKVKGFALGAVDYVTKPFQLEEVVARVRTHLELAQLRRELALHNARLEEIVAQRTRELARANARLAVLDQAKSDFLALISHELRTPLCGLCGTVELVMDECADNPATAEHAKMYYESRRRLLTLIDDALLLTQIGASADAGGQGQSLLEKPLAEALSQVEPLATSREVHFAPVPPDLGSVRGSADYLARALQSLLETAIKFARPGTIVNLAKTSAGGETSLIIEAVGYSIPPDVLSHFFDLLAVAKPITSGGDLGLGPALAERIVTLVGGAVSVENLDPPGVCLTVRFKTLNSTEHES